MSGLGKGMSECNRHREACDERTNATKSQNIKKRGGQKYSVVIQ